MKPVKNLLHIELIEPDEKTKSGIIMQKAWQSPPNTGTVISVGENVSGYGEGDKVIFNAYALVTVDIDGKANYLIRDDDILGTLNG